MDSNMQKLEAVWSKDKIRMSKDFERKIPFDEVVASIITVGPFYAYIVDFSDYSLSHVTPSIQEITGLDPEKITFKDIIDGVHPDDMEYVQKAEAYLSDYNFKHIPSSKHTKYKSSYNFRIRLKDGSFALFNHQALMLTIGDDGGFGKALNIHTRIDHLTDVNNYRFSLIGLENEPSFLNLSNEEVFDKTRGLSKKEKEVLHLLASGLGSIAIAEKLFISHYTVKKHRANILRKANCKNTAQLINITSLNGLI